MTECSLPMFMAHFCAEDRHELFYLHSCDVCRHYCYLHATHEGSMIHRLVIAWCICSYQGQSWITGLISLNMQLGIETLNPLSQQWASYGTALALAKHDVRCTLQRPTLKSFLKSHLALHGGKYQNKPHNNMSRFCKNNELWTQTWIIVFWAQGL